MLQQVPVALGRDDAQVEAQPVVRHDRRLRRALGGDVDHPGKRDRSGRRAPAGSVAVAMMSRSRTVSRMRRAEPASDTSTEAGCSAQLLDRPPQPRQGRTEQRARAAPRRPAAAQRLGDLLPRCPRRSGVPAELSRLGGRLERRDRRDPELLPDPPGRLRPEPGQPHERRDLGRHLRLALRERVHLAVVDDLDDLALDRLSDPLQLLRLPVERELGDRRRRLSDPRRSPAIRVDRGTSRRSRAPSGRRATRTAPRAGRFAEVSALRRS